MMFPKALYEAFPYVYMTTGIAEIGYFQSLLATGSGLLFFLAGALIWVMRSNARRTDPAATRKNSSTGQVWYELKPFLFIAAGVLIVNYLDARMVYPIAGLIILVGFYIVLLRTTHRAKYIKYNRNT